MMGVARGSVARELSVHLKVPLLQPMHKWLCLLGPPCREQRAAAKAELQQKQSCSRSRTAAEAELQQKQRCSG